MDRDYSLYSWRSTFIYIQIYDLPSAKLEDQHTVVARAENAVVWQVEHTVVQPGRQSSQSSPRRSSTQASQLQQDTALQLAVYTCIAHMPRSEISRNLRPRSCAHDQKYYQASGLILKFFSFLDEYADKKQHFSCPAQRMCFSELMRSILGFLMCLGDQNSSRGGTETERGSIMHYGTASRER